ncbi:MAG: hypothetical protein C4526_08120 [Nitrospiraceae bacterium]|nr:MAG: hypothetical protein C4526_08120 [Nitrospiraceae bacterium]
MVARLLITVSLFLLPLLTGGCSLHHQSPKGDQTAKIVSVTKNDIALKPAGSYEECVALKRGQVIVYKFNSTNPVDFNIHYHLEDAVKYPVMESEITEYDGTFNPEKDRINLDNEEYFCLMWENQDFRQLKLSYECMVKEK